MKIEKLSTWLTLLSNLGVLIGIVIVVVELNQNKTALESEIEWSHAEIGISIASMEATNPDLAAILVKTRCLTEDQAREMRRDTVGGGAISYQMFASRTTARLIYYQARFFTETSPDERDALAQVLQRFVSYPLIEIWKRGSSTYRNEYVDFVNQVVEDQLPSLESQMEYLGCAYENQA